MKDYFLAMVSHELRTPLNSILGWTQLLATASPDARTWQRGLEVIGRNTRFQAELISDLLDVSRIVSGKLLLDVQEVDLASLMQDAVQTVHPLAIAKQVRRIRALETDGANVLPAIALTAFRRPEKRTRALAGYQAHLAKPVDPLELIATIASLVGLRRG